MVWTGRVSPLCSWGPLEGRGRRVPTLCRRMHRPSTASVARAWPNWHSHHQRDGAYPSSSHAGKERARNRRGAAVVRLSSGTCLSSPLPDPEIWLEIPSGDETTHHAPHHSDHTHHTPPPGVPCNRHCQHPTQQPSQQFHPPSLCISTKRLYLPYPPPVAPAPAMPHPRRVSGDLQTRRVRVSRGRRLHTPRHGRRPFPSSSQARAGLN